MDAFRAVKQYGLSFCIIAFLILPLWAFWDTYWFRQPRDYVGIEHIHALPSFLWCLLLALQVYFISRGKTEIHRRLGHAAFLLGPAFIITTALISWGSLTYGEISEGAVYMFAVRGLLLSSFVVFFGLAIIYRKTPQLHARWMLCSALVLLDPILNRITDNFTDVSYTTGLHQYISFAVMDIIVLALFLMDIRSGKTRILGVALLVLIAGQLITLLGWDSTLWYKLSQSTPPFPFN